MKNVLITLLFSSLSILSNAQRVLIIGIDGARADVIESANTPAIDSLIANGLYSKDALNSDITISGPGWSAILCGVWSDKHGVTNNGFGGSNYEDYPSFFKRVEEVMPELNTVSISQWHPINNQIVQQDADVTVNATSGLAVEMEVVDQLINGDPHVIFAHFDDADGAGHSTGFTNASLTYREALEEIDGHIANIMSSLNQRPDVSNEDWVVLLSSDHGGLGFSHGGNSFDEQNVPFIASGDHVPLEVISKDSSLLQVNNCLSDSVELFFDGSNDYVSIPQNTLFDFGTNRDFTIECRVRTDIAADVSIVGNKDWSSGNNKGFVFSFKFSSGPEWKVNIGDGTNRVDINTGGPIADNQWHTLSVSFDRDGLMRMYEDGVFVEEANISSIGDINTGAGLVFGADIDQDFDFLGSIAEVRVWDEVLSDQAIFDFHCAKLDASHPSYNSLLGYWQMNEGVGSTSVIDYSVNGNDGTITGAEWTPIQNVYEYDYTHTPRIMDIPVSALAHLCIPIDTAWNLDGRSWVKDCVYNDRDCANPLFNRWIGDSVGEWHDEENWSRGFIPKVCDNVIIPDGNQVSLKPQSIGECRSIQVEGNSQINLLDGAVLNVELP